MISICIPIYNLDITPLVRSLFDQTKKSTEIYEIVMIDDGSEANFKKLNKPYCSKIGKYIELSENIGRARIRNLFLQHSQYDYLLFLDCDSKIVSDTFLNNYLKEIKLSTPSIICGGRIYSDQKPEKDQFLNWKYGTLTESQPASVRKKNPNKSFMTNNFVIRRAVLEAIRFDERITKYGHEDTLFGYQLKKREIQIQHIENPVLHGDLENNLAFLKKTELGIVNLMYMLKYVSYDKDFINDVTLLKFYYRLKEKKLDGVMAFFFKLIQPVMKELLSKGIASLFLFNLYKIGFLCNELQ